MYGNVSKNDIMAVQDGLNLLKLIFLLRLVMFLELRE